MMVFDIYVVGGGKHMVDFLNSVAMYASANGIGLTAKIALAYGALWMMGNVAFRKVPFEELVKYMVGIMVFSSVVINTKVDTYVHDPINPEISGRKVSNVPLGLAFLTSLSTTIDYGATRGIETVFSTPGDLKYTSTGMMMAQDMVIKASRATVTNNEFRQNLSGFLKHCVLYDIQLGHYSLDDVIHSEDMWGFFADNAATESRAFQYNGSWVTCADGLTKLIGDWVDETDMALQSYADRFFPGLSHDLALTQFVQVLPVSYQSIVGVSNSASELLQQNMMINMFYDSVSAFNMSADNTTATEAYINARTELQTINTNLISGQQNGRWIVYMKTTLLLILVGCFVLLAPFALLPGGFKRFVSGYAGVFFMLCLWGPIYAFLNYLQLNKSISDTAAIASGLTAATQSGITIVNARIASQASTFFGYIPYISMVLTGIGTGFASMMQSGLSASGRAAAAVANDVTTGNISMGNTTQGVHAYNNISGNKMDTSGLFKSANTFTQQLSNGSMLTSTGNGGHVLNTNSAFSNLDTGKVFSRDSVSKVLNKEGSTLIESGQTQAAEASEKRGIAMSGGINNALNKFNHRANGQSWNYGEDSRESNSARYVNNMSSKFADQFGITQDQAKTGLAAVYASGSMTLGGGVAEFFGAKVQTGARGEKTWVDTEKQSEMQQWVKDNINSKEFNNSMETLWNAGKNDNATINNGDGLDSRQTYAETVDWAKTRIDSARADIRHGKQFRAASSDIANSSFELSQNYQQKFYEWLQGDQSQGGKGLTLDQANSLFESKNMDEVRPYAQEFLSNESESIFKEWQEQHQKLDKDFNAASQVTGSTVEANYTTQAATIDTVKNEDQLNQYYQTTAPAEALPGSDIKPVKTTVEEQLSSRQTEVSNRKAEITAPSTPSVKPEGGSSDIPITDNVPPVNIPNLTSNEPTSAHPQMIGSGYIINNSTPTGAEPNPTKKPTVTEDTPTAESVELNSESSSSLVQFAKMFHQTPPLTETTPNTPNNGFSLLRPEDPTTEDKAPKPTTLNKEVPQAETETSPEQLTLSERRERLMGHSAQPVSNEPGENRPATATSDPAAEVPATGNHRPAVVATTDSDSQSHSAQPVSNEPGENRPATATSDPAAEVPATGNHRPEVVAPMEASSQPSIENQPASTSSSSFNPDNMQQQRIPSEPLVAQPINGPIADATQYSASLSVETQRVQELENRINEISPNGGGAATFDVFSPLENNATAAVQSQPIQDNSLVENINSESLKQ
jgi:conjugal transfer mating pair stabilization protein TraG